MEAFIGTILMWPMANIPSGWFPCDGRILPVNQYAALFSLIGNKFGGDGQKTFALPDMRGRFPVGINGLPGTIDGAQMGGVGGAAAVAAPLPAHTHTAATQATSTLQVGTTGSGQTVTPGGYLVVSGPGQVAAAIYQSTDPGAKNTVQGVQTSAATTVAAAGVPNAQIPVTNPYLGMQFIICNLGLYPQLA